MKRHKDFSLHLCLDINPITLDNGYPEVEKQDIAIS